MWFMWCVCGVFVYGASGVCRVAVGGLIIKTSFSTQRSIRCQKHFFNQVYDIELICHCVCVCVCMSVWSECALM